MKMKKKNLFTLIPKVDEILEKEEIQKILKDIPRKTVSNSIRIEIENIRTYIKQGKTQEEINDIIGEIFTKIEKRAIEKDSFNLKRVVNGTGIVIHTNLGRSLMSKRVMDNIVEIATNYSNLEYDLNLGKRGSRYSHLEDIITEITGGESALVVNNNAAAVMLVLSTLAKEKEVVVSRDRKSVV